MGMTRQPWKDLTPEQRWSKVADLSGFYDEACPPGPLSYPSVKKWMDRKEPDYLSDLNAMHEVVNDLNEEDTDAFCHELMSIVGKGNGCAARSINATAAQRAEAFVLTMENSD